MSNPDSYIPEVQRTLPHSAEAEQGVIGSMLISPRDAIGDALELVGASHFHIPAHSTIFSELVTMWGETDQQIDFITLTQRLKDNGQLDQVGGAAFVTQLFCSVPSAANLRNYLEIVLEKWKLRRVIEHSTASIALAYDEQDNVEGVLSHFERGILELSEQRASDDYQPTRELVNQAVDGIEQIYERKGKISGISTGFAELDKMTDGLHATEMIVIAARPSMGKTALAMNIAEHAATAGKSVGVFSLEMSKQQLIQRMVTSRARISFKKIRDGFLSERDFQKLTHAASEIAAMPLHFNDKSGVTPNYLTAVARRWHRKFGLDMIVVDYLQLMTDATKRSDNREQEVSRCSKSLKALAKDLQIPVLVLAQLNRNPEGRKGNSKGRPMLSDLRESGSIEQDADLVGLLYREEYYADGDEEMAELEGKATLIIAKQRNGPVGDVPLTFLKELTRFEDRAKEDREVRNPHND